MAKKIKFYDDKQKTIQAFPELANKTFEDGLFSNIQRNNFVDYKILYNYDGKKYVTNYAPGKASYELHEGTIIPTERNKKIKISFHYGDRGTIEPYSKIVFYKNKKKVKITSAYSFSRIIT